MSGEYFVDTNILVYSRDASEGQKQVLAEQWLSHLWRERAGRISTQVLNEYFVTVTSKLAPGLPRAEAWADVESLFAWRPLAVDDRLLRVAHRVHETFGQSWWDSLIVAAGQVLGCAYLLTEDLQDGRDFDGLMVVDPFKHDVSEITWGERPDHM